MLISVLVPVEVLHVIGTYAASLHGISIRELQTQLDSLSLTDLRYASAGRRGQRSAAGLTRVWSLPVQNLSGVLAKRRSRLLHHRPASFQADGTLVPADLDRSAAHVWTSFSFVFL